MLKFTILVVLSFSLSLSGGVSAASNQHATLDDLDVTARDFLRIWLVQRDDARAIKYVSERPILGSCMAPPYLAKKRRLSSKDISKVFRKALKLTLDRTPEARGLDALLDSSPVIPSNDNNVVFLNHSMPQYFQVFQLKSVTDPVDIAYVCRFDERESFRKAVAQSNVYYLFARVRGKESCPTQNVALLWRKEGKHWRILTISLAEGE